MELHHPIQEDNAFQEEFLALRREVWDIFPPENDGIFSLFENPIVSPPPIPQENGGFFPIDDDLAMGLIQQDYVFDTGIQVPSTISFPENPMTHAFGVVNEQKLGEVPELVAGPVRGVGGEKKCASKNLMAERRRRKRLNDRLSMLRSVVPKISKMDRTSILGDTIEYTRELLGRLKSLQEEVDVNGLNLLTIFHQLQHNNAEEKRSTPKFDVEKRGSVTRIEVCCGGKPGLLHSTLNTMEALGLEIQQCVMSCFGDFVMQALCLEGIS
ncbi:hypothetical protein AMTR_s00184p00048850 [Amborella trichopoda]|uniref:BHLH domain-containing protein n=1 Tax=Amborella trichopoda TaxID=13333 RepID=W1PV58_AMBTC|nr:hypothetical protein AMTR_s00184p00048850 [Amborella trichopoda]